MITSAIKHTLLGSLTQKYRFELNYIGDNFMNIISYEYTYSTYWQFHFNQKWIVN